MKKVKPEIKNREKHSFDPDSGKCLGDIVCEKHGEDSGHVCLGNENGIMGSYCLTCVNDLLSKHLKNYK